MWQLDYGRDNRLRLYFLGVKSWQLLDKSVSPSEAAFMLLMRDCLRTWHRLLRRHGRVVLVLGDTACKHFRKRLPEVVAALGKEVGGYSVICEYADKIPNLRRVRRECRGSLSETILVLAKK